MFRRQLTDRLTFTARSSTAPRFWRSLLIWVLALVVSSTAMAEPATAKAPTAQVSESKQLTQPYLDRVKQQVTTFTLDNGMTFVVLERHQAPIVSFVTYANVGGAEEPDGKTGVAHFLEHLAFKGTTRIGTRDYAKEKKLLDLLDDLDRKIRAAHAAGRSQEVERLQAEFDRAQADASALGKQNELGQIVERYGGVGLNATTSSDATRYFYSFPSNKLELWMSLESERFLDPVFREFYEEKAVILEERRLRVDNSPIGQLVEAILDRAFTVHPYRRPVIGYLEDLQNMTRKDIRDFFSTYYVPQNLTIAIVGDVQPNRVKQLAQIYFGRFRPGKTPPLVTAVEPEQTATREVTLQLKTQPIYIEGYHRPAITDPNHVVYEMLNSILSDGRTSRLYKSLVEEKKLALFAQGFNGFPGDKFPNLLIFYALTAPNHTVDELSQALDAELTRIVNEPVTPMELERVKTQARAGLLRSLSSNMGLAMALAEYQAKTGNWQTLFNQLAKIEAITAADIQQAAQQTFRPENRTIGRALPLAE